MIRVGDDSRVRQSDDQPPYEGLDRFFFDLLFALGLISQGFSNGDMILKLGMKWIGTTVSCLPFV